MNESVNYICSDCGADVKEDAKVCPKCGGDLGENVETPRSKTSTFNTSTSNTYEVVYEKISNSFFSLQGGGSISINRDEIVIKGPVFKWWKLILGAILFFPLFAVLIMLGKYGTWGIITGFGILALWLKAINYKSIIIFSRPTIKNINQLENDKISFDAIHPKIEKRVTIIIKFNTIERCSEFVDKISKQ